MDQTLKHRRSLTMPPPWHANLALMREFYTLFPYPSQRTWGGQGPLPLQHLLAHCSFYQRLLSGHLAECQNIWFHYRGPGLSKRSGPQRAEPGRAKALGSNPLEPLMHALEIFNRNEKQSPFKILLAGCGTDEPLLFAKLHPHSEIIGVDLSARSLITAEMRLRRYLKTAPQKGPYPNIQFTAGDVCSYLNQEPQEFDFIQCFGVLHHQPNPREFLHEIAKATKENTGFLRLMIYSHKGRTLERGLQRRWGQFSYLKSLWALTWLLCKRIRYPNSWNRRLGYIALSPQAVADALLHPSDPGLNLSDLTQWFKEEGLDIVFCEAKIHEVGWVSGWYSQNPQDVWQTICDADGSRNLLTNPVVVLRRKKGCLAP